MRSGPYSLRPLSKHNSNIFGDITCEPVMGEQPSTAFWPDPNQDLLLEDEDEEEPYI